MTQSECVAMENEILLYTDETGKMNVNVRFAEEDVWVTQVQLAEIYATTRQNIGQHIENIYKDNELPREATIKKFFIVQTEKELQRLNLMVSQFLDFAELQALDEKAMTMQSWINALDNQIVASQRKILEGNGTISHEKAIEKAEHEYDLYRQKELANLKSDFDLFMEDIKKIDKLMINCMVKKLISMYTSSPY